MNRASWPARFEVFCQESDSESISENRLPAKSSARTAAVRAGGRLIRAWPSGRRFELWLLLKLVMLVLVLGETAAAVSAGLS